MLFAIVDDVKILAPPYVIREIVEVLADIAWSEAGLTTQVVKNMIYLRPTLRPCRMEALP